MVFPPPNRYHPAVMTRNPSVESDRRPLRSRELPVFRALADAMSRRGVSPNAISVGGMIAGIAAGCALVSTACPRVPASAAWILGAVLVQLRLLANMLDGMVAIASGRASAVGEIYNEIPDRVSDTAVLVGLGYAAGGDPVLGYAAALAAMFTAYVRAMGKAAGTVQCFDGPMAKPQRMFLTTIVALYAGIAPSGWQPVCPVHPGLGLPAAVLAVILAGSLVTAVRRLRKIASALRAG